VQLALPRWSLVFLLCLSCDASTRGAQRPPTAKAASPATTANRPDSESGGVSAEPPPPAPQTSVEVPKSKPARKPGAWANIDPDDDDTVGPPERLEDCEGELKRAGVIFAKATLAVHEERFKKSKLTCGAPQVVTYLRGPGGITYSAPPLLSCAMAAALATFERILQEEAEAIFQSKVARIDHLGSYNCREMAAYRGWVSEHAYANAIDVARFTLKNGRVIDILRDFDRRPDEPQQAAGRFLRVISRRANDEDVFSHVLTPFYDALHKDHFHLDLARDRADGTRPRG